MTLKRELLTIKAGILAKKAKLNLAIKMAQMLIQTIQKADQNLMRKNLAKVAINLDLIKKMDLNLIKKLIKNLAKNHHRNLIQNLKQTIKMEQIWVQMMKKAKAKGQNLAQKAEQTQKIAQISKARVDQILNHLAQKA